MENQTACNSCLADPSTLLETYDTSELTHRHTDTCFDALSTPSLILSTSEWVLLICSDCTASCCSKKKGGKEGTGVGVSYPGLMHVSSARQHGLPADSCTDVRSTLHSRTYVNVNACIYVYTYVCMYVCMYVYIYVCMYIYIYICICIPPKSLRETLNQPNTRRHRRARAHTHTRTFGLWHTCAANTHTHTKPDFVQDPYSPCH